ncbi:MAG: FKBP-type peptidyl-prolyl cis-trans isomerase [Alistipes sp.]|nr:FKBP-type peptidyl-prolyl cis-trans isomerase [Alistipes sp.]MDE6711565.1 FKBP-type peptidyl-prolyl cis-trans isomerase [Alistipes sp.]
MKRALLLLAFGAMIAACSKNRAGGVKLRVDTDSVAYVLGMNIGLNLQRMDSTINADAVCEGIRDAMRGSTKLTLSEAETYYLRYMNYALPEKARAYEERFLADIAKSNRAYARTTSGVTYTVAEVGDQNRIPNSDRDTVAIRYVIKEADGREIYSSYERGDTLRSAVGDLRRGVRESLKLVGKGGRIDAWLPASTAYGAEGDAELGIGPNATLYYELELVDVVKYSTRRR